MILRLFAFLCILCTPAAHAALQFAETALVVKATTQDKELQARYSFTNSGSDPIWIVQLTTSCGCTTAVADKTEYQPGEAGTITATYTIGLSQGRHSHTINVQTSEPNAPPYVLKITADLPAGNTPLTSSTATAVLTPRELVWSRPPYATKTVSIDLKNVPDAKLTATCDSDQFELKLEDTTRPATLQITPRPTAGSTRAEITLQITPSDGQAATTQKIPLTLIVLKNARPQAGP